MDKLTFKNYPPSILAILFCLIIALNFGFQILWQTFRQSKTIGLWEEILCILLSYSTILEILRIVNKHCKWKWLFNLLGLTDVSGNYVGTLISSFHIDDDPSKPHVTMFCRLQIVQNINAIELEGGLYTDEDFNERSSDFKSYWEEIRKKSNGDFIITYFYSTRGNKLHRDDNKYKLTNHDGIGVLTFSPSNNTIEGYYFNHQRFSNGQMSLKLQSKIL